MTLPDGWTMSHLAACEGCGKSTAARDADGRPLHVWCADDVPFGTAVSAIVDSIRSDGAEPSTSGGPDIENTVAQIPRD